MKKQDEQILVAPTEKVFETVDVFHGLHISPPVIKNLMKSIEHNITVRRRGDKKEPKSEQSMESNTDYKQPIPYIVLKKGDKIFTYKL
jgi:predicted NUDIX family phosphoesterase